MCYNNQADKGDCAKDAVIVIQNIRSAVIMAIIQIGISYLEFFIFMLFLNSINRHFRQILSETYKTDSSINSNEI